MSSEITDTIADIFDTFDILDDNVEKIDNKIEDIMKVLEDFKDNRSLTLDNTVSYLNFQIELLITEKEHNERLKNICLKKMYKEILNIYDYIVMIISSLENLEIKHEQEKENIMKKLIIFKKSDKLNQGAILQLTNAIVNNLALIEKFISLFELYIHDISLENTRNNIHCNSLDTILMNKKNHIDLEYKSYQDQFLQLIDYYHTCSSKIRTQVKDCEFINFLVNKNV